MRKYSDYINSIRESLQEQGVGAKDLTFYLLTLSAFNHSEQKEMLLLTHEAELNRADDLIDVLKVIMREYASFMNYEIFQYIVDKYKLDNGEEAFKYPEHLEAYVNRLKIAEFAEINPLLKESTDASKKL